MRYAVLADIHGNLHALDAVLEAVRPLGVDDYLVAGDLVGYGPFPNECVARVAELRATCVAGNHDLMVLGLLTDERCIPLARRSLAWTREVLRDDARAYLQGLPRRVETGGVVITHGSLDHSWEYTRRPDQAVRQLARVAREHPGARTLVLGHTHRVWACEDTGRERRPGPDGIIPLPSGLLLVNPGAVGQSRELKVRARFVVLDLENRTASFQSVRYDAAACRDALRERGLSPRSHHLRPTARGAVRRFVSGVRRAGTLARH